MIPPSEKNDATDGSTRRADVRATYDRIAPHFSKTREHPWSEVQDFLDGRRGDISLDIGCGNGRHAELLADHTQRVIGIDLSRAALNQARARADERGFDVSLLQGDATALPIRSRQIDLAVYIATLHHLPTRTARIESLDELARVLTLEGRALVSAWSVTHPRFDREAEDGFDTTVDWTLPSGETVPRFYHIYAPAGFERDIEASALDAVETFVASGNCYAVVRGGKTDQ